MDNEATTGIEWPAGIEAGDWETVSTVSYEKWPRRPMCRCTVLPDLLAGFERKPIPMGPLVVQGKVEPE